MNTMKSFATVLDVDKFEIGAAVGAVPITLEIKDAAGLPRNAEFFEMRSDGGDSNNNLHFTIAAQGKTIVPADANKMWQYPGEDRFEKPVKFQKISFYSASISSDSIYVYVRAYGYEDMSGSTLT